MVIQNIKQTKALLQITKSLIDFAKSQEMISKQIMLLDNKINKILGNDVLVAPQFSPTMKWQLQWNTVSSIYCDSDTTIYENYTK